MGKRHRNAFLDYANPLFGRAVALLQMESRLFDNGQIEERSRFPYAESLNCAHGKYLHFKGLLHVCIMFDTGARARVRPPPWRGPTGVPQENVLLVRCTPTLHTRAVQ